MFIGLVALKRGGKEPSPQVLKIERILESRHRLGLCKCQKIQEIE
jgi:hypothetical protein